MFMIHKHRFQTCRLVPTSCAGTSLASTEFAREAQIISSLLVMRILLLPLRAWTSFYVTRQPHHWVQTIPPQAQERGMWLRILQSLLRFSLLIYTVLQLLFKFSRAMRVCMNL